MVVGPFVLPRLQQVESLRYWPPGLLPIILQYFDTRWYVKTLAGNGRDGSIDGIGDEASFASPMGCSFDSLSSFLFQLLAI